MTIREIIWNDKKWVLLKQKFLTEAQMSFQNSYFDSNTVIKRMKENFGGDEQIYGIACIHGFTNVYWSPNSSGVNSNYVQFL